MHGLAASVSEREGVEGRLDTKSWACFSLLLSKQQEKWENWEKGEHSGSLKVANSLHVSPSAKTSVTNLIFPSFKPLKRGEP